MMKLTEDIRSLSDFKRDTAGALEHLRKSHRPMVLTVNGRAEMVVQDAESYQATLDALERVDANTGIRHGLRDVAEGRTRPARQVLAEMKERIKGPKAKRASISR